MGKSAENESVKLRATYYNNVAVGLGVAGGLIPYIGLVQGIATNWPPDPWVVYPICIATFIAVLASLSFRRLAQATIAELQD
jgi:phosphotransferase system  glucose/maltose/N-acetylglucosamine-specific IIC component